MTRPALPLQPSAAQSFTSKLPSNPVTSLASATAYLMPQAKEAKTSWMQRSLPRALLAMALLVFVGGMYVVITGIRTNGQVKAQARQFATATGQDTFAGNSTDTQADSINSYQVAPDKPRIVESSALGIKARIMPTGTDADNRLQTPANLRDVSWYNQSSLPGAPGAMLLYGHLSGWDEEGVFKNLKKAQPGTPITVQRGDSKNFTYRVVKSISYDVNKVDMAMVLKPVSGKGGLNLMTCDGSYDPHTKEFTRRLVVFAELAN
jgi:sortase (surface protein transpeptidase)